MDLNDAPQLLAYATVAAEVDAYTYPPGWAVTTYVDPFEGPCLYVTALVADGYRDGGPLPLRIRVNLPPMPSVEYLAIWLWWRLDLVARHELREMFRRDGRPVFDPHDIIEPGSPPEHLAAHAARLRSVANSPASG